MNIRCCFKGHDWEVETVSTGENTFVVLSKCKRCCTLFWMKGETGYMKGVRFIKSNRDYTTIIGDITK